MRHPLILWPLLFLLVFLALGGLYGGIAMLTDTTGASLQLTEVLPLLPVSSFALPGLFLLIVMGLTPLVLIYGLLTRPQWTWMEKILGRSGHHWAWTCTLGLGVTLIIWLMVQAMLIGFKWPIQYITVTDGVLIILLVLMPGVRRF